MLYSIVGDTRKAPFPRGRGLCPYCGGQTIAKCGRKITWHWSHLPNPTCDPWWENETEWHRQWKAVFPKSWQEIIHTDELTGEKHIADIKTPTGLVLEFQNSPMSFEEMRLREGFYNNLIWIINGQKFSKNFHILAAMPNPVDEWVDDFVFVPLRHDYYNSSERLACWRKSDNPDHEPGQLVLAYNNQDIYEKVSKSYIGHHMFHWVKPRINWYEAKKTVLFDFGDTKLWKLQTFGSQTILVVQAIDKSSFISGIINHANEPRSLNNE